MYDGRRADAAASTIPKEAFKKISWINEDKGNPIVNMMGFVIICMVLHMIVCGNVGDAVVFGLIPGTDLFGCVPVTLFIS